MISLIVFSKDRAMQLDSLLRSVVECCDGIDHVDVIARASSDLHVEAYKQVVRLGTGFDAMVIDGPGNDTPIGQHIDVALHASDHVALAVDDMLFYRASDFKQAAETLNEHNAFAWSWRLGHRTCLGELVESEFCGCVEGCLSHWLCSPFVDDPDYRYMFHSDGALYCTTDYVNMLDKWLPYWRTGRYTPNDLEAAVASFAGQWRPLVGPHLGPLEPTCITWQLNRVQTKYGSPAAEIPETNVDALARAYLDGKRVNNEILYAMLQANALNWNPPGARPTHVYASEEASKVWASCIE